MTAKHSHYFKDVSHLSMIDVYRVLLLFGVTDPCLQHAAKKLLVAGGRGTKAITHDVQDAIDSLERWKTMRAEDRVGEPVMEHLPQIPDAEELMGAIDPAHAAFEWFEQVRFAVDEWAFKGIVRHLLKALETKLVSPAAPAAALDAREIEEAFLVRVFNLLRQRNMLSCANSEPLNTTTLHRLATQVMSPAQPTGPALEIVHRTETPAAQEHRA